MPPNTHWRVLPVLNESFWNFLRSVPPLTKTGKVVRFFENFFSHYLLEGNGLFGQKDLKLFLSSTPFDSSGRFERKIFIFSSFSTHWTKIAVWSKKSETFFFHYPTDMRCWSGPVFWEVFFLHYPLDKRSRFERKKIKKALGKFPKAVDFFSFSWYNKW